jgi:hypothetical protein
VTTCGDAHLIYRNGLTTKRKDRPNRIGPAVDTSSADDATWSQKERVAVTKKLDVRQLGDSLVLDNKKEENPKIGPAADRSRASSKIFSSKESAENTKRATRIDLFAIGRLGVAGVGGRGLQGQK